MKKLSQLQIRTLSLELKKRKMEREMRKKVKETKKRNKLNKMKKLSINSKSLGKTYVQLDTSSQNAIQKLRIKQPSTSSIGISLQTRLKDQLILKSKERTLKKLKRFSKNSSSYMFRMVIQSFNQDRSHPSNSNLEMHST